MKEFGQGKFRKRETHDTEKHEYTFTVGSRVPEKEPVIDRIEIMAKDGEVLTLAVRNRRELKWMGLRKIKEMP